MIIADAGPIIAFVRIGRLELLQRVVADLMVPEAVYDDLVVKGRGKPGADEVARSTWIRHVSIQDRDAVTDFPPVLEQGEREAIVLAEERRATLLMDDHRAREAAEERGIEVVGVLWVLGEAKRRGFVTEVRSIVEELLTIGYRLHPERVIRPFLQELGEAPLGPEQ
jgi:predicted nucleic acid-binding protein